MKVYKTKFKGLYVVKQKDNIDNRGGLRETYNKKVLNGTPAIIQPHFHHVYLNPYLDT